MNSSTWTAPHWPRKVSTGVLWVRLGSPSALALGNSLQPQPVSMMDRLSERKLRIIVGSKGPGIQSVIPTVAILLKRSEGSIFFSLVFLQQL